MPHVFLIGDLHFSHRRMVSAELSGQRLRPWTTVEAMDEALVERWNSVVQPEDKVYVLGDVAINRRGVGHLGRCHGRKHLILGNHDLFQLEQYAPFCQKITAYWQLDRFVLSHVPVHPQQLHTRFAGNVHGHLHEHTVGDDRYFSVSAERINYTPIRWDAVHAHFVAAGLS